MSTNSPLIVNSAHDTGLTKLCFSCDGKKLYTAGDDSVIRVWDTSKDASQEPKVVNDADEGVTSLDCSKNAWISSSHDSHVRKYNAANDTFEGLITRSPAVAVRCVALSPDGQKVAVTSDELEVKVIVVSDPLNVILLSGHKRGVRSASWHPAGEILTTCGQDGMIHAWTVTPEGSREPYSIDGIIPAVHDVESAGFLYDASAVWHPNGRYFVVASKIHDIVVVSYDTWTQVGSYSKGGGHTSAITALSFSINGRYLASAGADGQVLVWDTTSRSILFRRKSTSKVAIPSLRFSPTANHLAWTDVEGSLVRWVDPIPSSYPSPVKEVDALTNSKSINGQNKNPVISDDLFDDIGDEIVEGVDLEDEYKDDWIIDDELGEGYKKDTLRPIDHGPKGLREMVNVTKAQPAFQSGSTPFGNKKRYLAFNMIGVIEATDQETHQIINVEFHDKSLHRGYHFQDHHRFHLASLGPRGALYACAPEGDNLAVVNYRPYDTWASSAEWQVSLPEGESAIVVCAGGAPYKKGKDSGDNDDDDDENDSAGPRDAGGAGHCIVATSSGTIRFWLGTGVQTYVWHIGGEVVAMEAGAEWVFVVHREGGTSLDGCQNLKYTLMSLESYDVINNGSLPLGKGVTLQWIGITAEGAPTIYDSRGLLSILDRFRRPTQGRWVPFLDTDTLARKKGKDETYWAVGLSVKEFMCIILKGKQPHPGFPRPPVLDLEVHMPLLYLDTEQGRAEERIVREKIQITMLHDALPPSVITSNEIHRQELERDKVLISLIQTACKADKLERALDYTSMLHHLASFDLAQKVADFYHLPGLKEKMGMLRDVREDADDVNCEERDVRRGWGRIGEPVPRAGVANLDHSNGINYRNGHDSNRREFEDFRPPPVVPRRSLAAASPFPPSTLSEFPMPSSPPAAASTSSIQYVSGVKSDVFSDTLDSDVSAKRKYDEDMDTPTSELSNLSPKKKVSPFRRTALPSAPAKSTNPFARKKADIAPGPSSNPFARNGPGKTSIVKSNSFFDKVDAAESDVASHPKGRTVKEREKEEKTKKDGVAKQTTLFGLPPPPKASRKGKEKDQDKKASYDKRQTGPSKETTAKADDAQSVTPLEEDIAPPNGNAELSTREAGDTLEETQPSTQVLERALAIDDGRNQREASPDWDMTQDTDVEMDIAPAAMTIES